MPLVLVFVLAGIVLVAQYWPRSIGTLRSVSPLDVDTDLPLPEAGQGSSICSLTALFGPYLVFFLLFGMPALLGLILGSTSGLFMLWRHFGRTDTDRSYQKHLSRRLRSHPGVGLTILVMVVTQILFATSELLILKDIVHHGFDLSDGQSALFAVIVATIAYLYVINGGYKAVFRTDIIQYIFVVGMCLAIFGVSSRGGLPVDKHIVLGIDPHLWSTKWLGTSAHILNGALCFFVSLMFVIASPDSWKRVHAAAATGNRHQILRLLIAGALPFILMLPAALSTGTITNYDSPPLRIVIDKMMETNSIPGAIVLVGLTCSFLSSFDSALLSAVHLQIIRVDAVRGGFDSRANYYYTFGLSFLLVNAVAAVIMALPSVNIFALATVLLGPYAITCGFLVGSQALQRVPSPANTILIAAAAVLVWAMWLIIHPQIFRELTVQQVQTIPIGMAIMVSVAAATFFVGKRKH